MVVALLAAAATLLAAYRIGGWIVPEGMPNRRFVAVGAGTSALLIVLFAVFALRLAVKPVFIALLAVVAALAVSAIGKPSLDTAWLRRRTGAERVALVLLAALVLLHALGASAPSIDADGLGYHLLVPKLFLQQGGFADIPWNMYAAWPLNFDLLYGAGLAFESQYYGRYLHFLFGVLAMLLTLAVARSRFGDRAGIIAALILYTTPMIGVLSGTAYVDLYVLFFGFLFFIVVHDWTQRRADWRWPLLAGLLIGTAVGAKIVGFAFAIPALLFFLYAAWRKHRRAMPVIASTALFGLGAIILSLPWLLKSWILLGNPVWPFLYDVLGGEHWSSFAADALRNEVGSAQRGIIDFLLFPITITFRGGGEMGFLGAGYLCLGGIAIWLLWKGAWRGAQREFVISSLVFAGLHLATYYFLLHETRYVIFLLPALAILAALPLTVDWRPAPIGQLLLAVLVVTVALNLPFTIAYNGKSIPVALGADEAYLSRNLDAYPALAWANANLPPDAKVYTSTETRTFYLEREQLWGAPNRQAIIDFGAIGSGDELRDALVRENVTHYLTTPLARAAMLPGVRMIEEEFVSRHCAVLFRQGEGLVCRIMAPEAVPQR